MRTPCPKCGKQLYRIIGLSLKESNIFDERRSILAEKTQPGQPGRIKPRKYALILNVKALIGTKTGG